MKARRFLSRILFFLGAAFQLRGRDRVDCPSCGEPPPHEKVDSKWGVTALLQCARCRLFFRTPREVGDGSRRFYQRAYTEGVTTQPPDDATLAKLLESQFVGHEKDYRRYIELLRAVGVERGSRVLDYGCSWGYGTWQLAKADFDVQGYEISAPRADFGRRRLGVKIADTLDDLGQFDVVLAAHVLEHVPSAMSVIRQASRLLRPGGVFVAFTPNGSEEFRRRNGEAFRRSWGMVHPNVLNEEFYAIALSGHPYLMVSSSCAPAEVGAWDRKSQSRLDLSGAELGAFAIN